MARNPRLPPIARLPVELLACIFLLGAHTPDKGTTASEDTSLSGEHGNSEDISPCLSSSSTSPDVFAAVNRHWREVALGTPQLWTRISVTIGDVMPSRDTPFDAVSRYTSRSGRCPLDVFIDGRDPEWDFSETDDAVVSPYCDDLYDYLHPFKVEHMHHALNILLPHVQRIRSLVILTDRWAHMQTALDCLSMEDRAFVSVPRPLPFNLPLLETLVLMRCNEFVSYHSEFSPTDGKDAASLPFSALLRASENVRAQNPVLPNLQKLVLSGVHTQWAALPRLLAPSCSSHVSELETMELSYHCNDVRPSVRDFRALLECCTHLRTLSIRVSGPHPPDIPPDRDPTRDTEWVSLPKLETIVIGYDDSYTAATILDMLDALEARSLTLENASSLALEEPLDAEPLLLACTTTARPDCPSQRRPYLPFPHVEKLSLHKVEASAEAFKALYEALPSLRALTVSQMFLLGGGTLSPNVQVTFVPPVLPATGRVTETVDVHADDVVGKLPSAHGCNAISILPTLCVKGATLGTMDGPATYGTRFC